MELTNAQKEEYLTQYDGLFHAVVYRFMAKRGKYNPRDVIFDDLYQEVRLAFLDYLERCKTEEEMKVIPFKSMNHAMCMFFCANCGLGLPKVGTSYKKSCEFDKKKVYYDQYSNEYAENVLFTQGYSLDSMADVDFYIDFERFILTLNPDVRTYIHELLRGDSVGEVAKRHGLSHQIVSYKKQQALNKYKEHRKKVDQLWI